MKIPIHSTLCAVFAATLALSPVRVSASEMGLVLGQGDKVNIIGLAVRSRDWNTTGIFDRPGFAVSGEWQLSRWQAKHQHAEVSTIADGSYTVVLTFTPHAESISSPAGATYVEMGLGIHLISEQSIGTDREFGSAFQFGEFIGGGLRFGSSNRYTLGLRVQHVSNGRTSQPNDGITFVEGVIRCSF